MLNLTAQADQLCFAEMWGFWRMVCRVERVFMRRVEQEAHIFVEVFTPDALKHYQDIFPGLLDEINALHPTNALRETHNQITAWLLDYINEIDDLPSLAAVRQLEQRQAELNGRLALEAFQIGLIHDPRLVS